MLIQDVARTAINYKKQDKNIFFVRINPKLVKFYVKHKNEQAQYDLLQYLVHVPMWERWQVKG